MDIQALIGQLSAVIKKLNSQQRTAVVASLVIVAAFIAFLVAYSASSQKKGDDGYRTLFDNLTAKDEALVVQQLEKDKIDYKLPYDGAIEVPKEVVEKERIAIAALGIPKDSKVGFELFDKQEFGATDFDKNIKYLRALEGELARTIASLSVVEDATVHIAIPKESVFTEKETLPTASVVVKIRSNMILAPKQVVGIKNLVAAAVPKLTPDNVKILDENGDPLGDNDETMQYSELAKQQLKYKKDYEKSYEDKIVKVLAPFLGGDDKVVAKVTIDFDFSQKDTSSETYDPNSVVRSEQVTEEKREGAAPAQVGGVPGAVSNIGPVQNLQSGSAGEKYTKNATTTNYEISKTVSNVKGEFAAIKRITAAVVVDGKYDFKKGADGAPTEELEYKALDKNEIESINNLVKQAVGFQGARNDEVSVSNFQFRTVGGTAPATGVAAVGDKFAGMIGPFLPVLKYLAAFAVLFLFYKKVIAPMSQKVLTQIPEVEEKPHPARRSIFAAEEEEEEEENEAARVKDMKKKLEEQLGIRNETDESALKYEVLLEKIKAITEERPEEVGSLFSTLINDESTSGSKAPLKE